MNNNNHGNIKTVILIIFGVILVAGLGVGIRYFIEKNNKDLNSQTETKNYYDCGSGRDEASQNCFSAYMKDCKLAKVSNPEQSSEIIIDGFNGDDCVISIKNSTSSSSSGEITCRIPKNELGNYESYLNNNLGSACSGINSEDVSEMYKEVADSQTISDLNTLKAAINLYLSTVSESDLNLSICKKGVIYSSDKGTYAVDGTGWLPIDFTKTSGGSPLSVLPIQSGKDGLSHYQFSCSPLNNSFVFELDAKLTSTRYSSSGTKDVVSVDGGDNPNIYEIGTNLNLIH